jgi:murein DD-endopeptidase MepM/ murein hydrolase activator NlpD
MNKSFFVWLAMAAGISAAAGLAGPQGAPESGILVSSFGAGVNFVPKSSVPGGIIRAAFNEGGSVRRVVLRFMGREYTLGKREDGLEPFALIGIDLDVKPGDYSLEAVFEAGGGEKEEARKEISISSRAFAVKRMRVAKSFAEPPPEVQERILKEAEMLKEIYGRTTPRWLAEGGFIKPHPVSVNPSFGERRLYGGNAPPSIHQGVDMNVPKGDPIKASNSGKVVLALGLYLSGNTVVIDHGLGLFTVYCHMSRLAVKNGDDIKKGNVVGFCGTTGRSTGPHLHWGVRLFQSRVDPVLLLGLPLD